MLLSTRSIFFQICLKAWDQKQRIEVADNSELSSGKPVFTEEREAKTLRILERVDAA